MSGTDTIVKLKSIIAAWRSQHGENEVGFLSVVLPAVLNLAPLLVVRGRVVVRCLTFEK